MRVAHYITPLKTDKIPPVHVVIDTETRVHKKHGTASHKWACGASCEVWRTTHDDWVRDDAIPHKTPASLWDCVLAAQPRTGKLVVWAHNLSFDLRISEALRYLPRHGYELEAIVLEKTAAWAAFESAQGSVLICDLFSWLPAKLDKMAAEMGEPRPRFDYKGATDVELLQRCTGDVRLTGEIVRIMLDWLSDNQPGSFRPTGSGQSHALWRRRFLLPKSVLVHSDQYALERERTAMWAGRAEAWVHGEVKGPIYEHDLNLAYCRIAAAHDVPSVLLHRAAGMPTDRFRSLTKTRAILSEVTVETAQPLVPTGDDERIYWPVGRFKTVLWEPEVLLLMDKGASVTIDRVWVYRRAPVLRPMAQWLIWLLTDPAAELPPPLKRLVKHWARTLVGRCALRFRRWEDFGTVPQMGLSLSTLCDLENGEETQLLHVGEKVMELTELAESDSSTPQITGWVMSKARANLWHVLAKAGLENVLYMDTDGLLVNAAGHKRLMGGKHWPFEAGLIFKTTWGSATIRGPRNVTLETVRRIAGVPVLAVQIGDLSFDGEVFVGVDTSLATRQPNTVTVLPRLFEVKDTDPRRQVQPDGKTLPFEVNDDEGE